MAPVSGQVHISWC